MCKGCIDEYKKQYNWPKCPVCNGQWRAIPIATWINNNEPESDPMDLVGVVEPVSLDRPAVLLIDVSASMNNPSGTQQGAPTRVELAVHMAKVLLAFCRKLKMKCVVYTFSEMVKKVLGRREDGSNPGSSHTGRH
jgi:hypothetical protein